MIQELKQNEKSEKYFYLREILVYSRVLENHVQSYRTLRGHLCIINSPKGGEFLVKIKIFELI